MKRRFLFIATSLLAAVAAAGFTRSESNDPKGLTVHEWGTFTSIAGEDGKPVNWQPWGGPTDLPCFVDRFKNLQPKASYYSQVRMETPVLYFYASREMTLNVNVRFPQGLITEWYPQAQVSPKGRFVDFSTPGYPNSVSWTDVKIRPKTEENFPQEDRPSHYYAARHTDAAPLEAGGQSEKFLFYRGIANFDLPISASVAADGRIQVKNLLEVEIPEVILFESRSGKFGYRTGGTVRDSLLLDSPSLDSNFESLKTDLESVLASRGLYPKEAAAMVETWRDSWFEEGMRLFYIMPESAVDSLLPLQVSPKPVKVARVFVGRMELLTPRTLNAARQAFADRNRAELEKYGRFLEPISELLMKNMNESERSQMFSLAAVISSAYRNRLAVCK
jgi:hypothetical protein